MAQPAARVMAQGAAGDWLTDYLPAGGRRSRWPSPGARWWRTRAATAARDPDPVPEPLVDEPFAIAGQAPSDPLPDASFAADPVAGGEDLWLPVDPTTASGLGETGDGAAMTHTDDQRHHTG